MQASWSCSLPKLSRLATGCLLTAVAGIAISFATVPRVHAEEVYFADVAPFAEQLPLASESLMYPSDYQRMVQAKPTIEMNFDLSSGPCGICPTCGGSHPECASCCNACQPKSVFHAVGLKWQQARVGQDPILNSRHRHRHHLADLGQGTNEFDTGFIWSTCDQFAVRIFGERTSAASMIDCSAPLQPRRSIGTTRFRGGMLAGNPRVIRLPRTKTVCEQQRIADCRDCLDRTPEFLGDFFFNGSCSLVEVGTRSVRTAFPGFVLGQKVSEHNNPLPRKRIYYTFNYFHNAVDYQFSAVGFPSFERSGQEGLVRHTIGGELPFWQDRLSVEARLPIDHKIVQNDNISGDRFGFEFGGIGNLFIVTKALLHRSSELAVSSGVGFEVPTGDDASAHVNDLWLTAQNEAFHIHPYAAFVWTPNRRWFVSAFGELDITTNGNTISVLDSSISSMVMESEVEVPSLYYIDAMIGYWFYYDQFDRKLTSLAALCEFHYIGTLDDGGGFVANFTGGIVECSGGVSSPDFQVTNITAGLHGECGPLRTVRVGVVAPLGSDRPFDAELIFQVGKKF